jgi:glutathione S-transferase
MWHLIARVLQRCAHAATRLAGWLQCDGAPPELVLTYFDARGLAQAIRETLRFGGVPFEDERLGHDEFLRRRAEFPFGQLPVLTVAPSEPALAQSKAILRYAGRLTRTLPTSSPMDMALCDAWIELHTEFMAPIVLSMYPERFGLPAWTPATRAAHRRWLHETHLPKYIAMLRDATCEGNEWIAGFDAPTVADICWVCTLEWLNDGTLDGVGLAGDAAVHAYVARGRAALDAAACDDDEASDDDEEASGDGEEGDAVREEEGDEGKDKDA